MSYHRYLISEFALGGVFSKRPHRCSNRLANQGPVLRMDRYGFADQAPSSQTKVRDVTKRVVLFGFMVATVNACSPSDQQVSDNPLAFSQTGGLQAAPLAPAFRGAGGNASPPTTTQPGVIRVQKADIVDRNGFGQPMIAATTMMPVGWQAQGGIDWQANVSGCGKKTPHFAWRATSPDGLSSMEILAEESWSGSNMQISGMSQQGCPNIQIQSAREYIQTWVQYNRPGARMLDYRDRYDFVEAVDKELGQLPVLPGTESRQWAEGGQALIGYSQQGTEMRELIGLAIMFAHFRMQDVIQGTVIETTSLSTLPGFSMRAPAGQLDFKIAEMLRKSGHPNQQWLAKIAQHNNKIAQINRKGISDRIGIGRKTANEIGKMQHDSWKKQTASGDYIQREAIEAIRGTETYSDPYYGGTVELDNTYKSAWQLNDGSYVLTDNPSFNPYEATGQDGRQLEVAQ